MPSLTVAVIAARRSHPGLSCSYRLAPAKNISAMRTVTDIAQIEEYKIMDVGGHGGKFTENVLRKEQSKIKNHNNPQRGAHE